MRTGNLVRRSVPETEGLTAFVDRYFNDSPMWAGHLPAFNGRFPIGQVEGWNPLVDVHEEADAYVFSADLPGVDKQNVEVAVEDNVLTITGERIRQDAIDKDSYRRLERSYGKFSRHFSLPGLVDSSKVDAKFTDGVLEVRVAKSEAARARKIEIR